MALSWAGKRRLIVFLVLGAILVVALGTVLAKMFYQAPSCADATQNEGEVGIDCGGPCPYACAAGKIVPTVLYALPLQDTSGRVDLVASVENKNSDVAAKNVSYTIALYGAGQSLIREVNGTLDLPPRTVVPVFLPSVTTGQAVEHAFLEIVPRSLKWYTVAKDPRIVPVVSNISLGGTASSPIVEATLTNSSVTRLTNVRAVALVHGTNGNIIAATATVVSVVPSQGQATATFIWKAPFQGPTGLIEVKPLIPLPEGESVLL